MGADEVARATRAVIEVALLGSNVFLATELITRNRLKIIFVLKIRITGFQT